MIEQQAFSRIVLAFFSGCNQSQIYPRSGAKIKKIRNNLFRIEKDLKSLLFSERLCASRDFQDFSRNGGLACFIVLQGKLTQ